MMVSVQESASKRFWRTPELVEALLPHLDAASILKLAKAHPPTIGILQGGSVWEKVIKSCICGTMGPMRDNSSQSDSNRKRLNEERARLLPLIELLKMMEEPRDCLVTLLDLICTRFPVDESRLYCNDDGDLLPEAVEVTCTNHSHHKVSALGFLVLEEVEGTLGSAAQSVQWLGLGDLGGVVLSSLSARMLRQHGMKIKLDLAGITCSTRHQAEELLVVLKNCEMLMATLLLSVNGDFSPEAWAALSKALQQVPGKCFIWATRKALLAGHREDLKVMFEAARSVLISTTSIAIGKEEGWGRLEQVLDMSEDQWEVEAQKDWEEDDDEEEEEEEEEDEQGEETEEEEFQIEDM